MFAQKDEATGNKLHRHLEQKGKRRTQNYIGVIAIMSVTSLK